MINVAESEINTIYGQAQVMVFRFDDGEEIPVLYKKGEGIPLVRIQSECFLGTVFSSTDCDCGSQLNKALSILFNNEHSLLIYMRNQEARGHGLYKKMSILKNVHQGYDLISARKMVGATADLRSYDKTVQILKQLKMDTIDLLTENETKKQQLEEKGIEINAIRHFESV